MIKFIFQRDDADTEELMDSVNRYVCVNKADDDLSGIYLPAYVNHMNAITAQINMLYKVNTGMPLQSSNKLKVLVKKIIRKIVKWYIDLIMDQQVELNAHVVRTINEEQEILKILVTKNATLENQIEKLQLKVLELEERIQNE